MNKIGLLSLGLAFAANMFAQDIIITRDAKKLETKVTEIGVYVVKYKLTSESDGPTYVLPKDKIAAITYENGRVETYFNGYTVSSDTVADSAQANNSEFVPKPVVEGKQQVEPAVSSSETVSVEPVQNEYTGEIASDDDYYNALLDYEERVKGLRFKVEVAPLFGAHEHFYGYRRDRYYDYNYRSDNEYAFHDSSNAINPGLNAAIGVGYQFNPIIYLGAGFDVAAVDNFDWVALSEFIEFNVFCLRYKATSPLVGLRAGITSLIEPDDNTGYFIEPSVGICHRFKNPKLALGVTIGYRVTGFDTDDFNTKYNGLYYDRTSVSSYFTKVSFSF